MLNVQTAAALCRSTRSACMQLLAERLREDSVFLCHLHARCTLSHPSFQHASRFSPLDLTPSHRLFSSTFLVYLAIELHKEVFPKAHVQLATGLTSPCHGVFLESLCHLPHTYHLQEMSKRQCDAQILKRLYGYVSVLICLHVTVIFLHCKHLSCF